MTKKLFLSVLLLFPISNLQASQVTATPLSKAADLKKRAQELLTQARISLRDKFLMSTPPVVHKPTPVRIPTVLHDQAAFEGGQYSAKLFAE